MNILNMNNDFMGRFCRNGYFTNGSIVRGKGGEDVFEVGVIFFGKPFLKTGFCYLGRKRIR